MIASVLLAPLLLFVARAAPPGWEETGTSDGITTYARDTGNSDVREVLAVGDLDAPPDVIHRALDDLGRYKDFMPYTKESRILKRAGDVVWTYERISAPFVSERDYTIRVSHSERKSAAGAVVVVHTFQIANAEGPPPVDGVVRVAMIEGRWELEPLDGGRRTRARYFLLSSPGGSVPTFAVNMANTTALPGIFKALSTVSKDGRYRAPKPPAPALIAPPVAPAP